MTELQWFVAHTRPRCEKKLVQYCEREGFNVSLPCYMTSRKYRGKTVVFKKPLFPGYVFLNIVTQNKSKVYHSDYVAGLLTVTDQELFKRQLDEIFLALQAELQIRVVPLISEGTRVKIKHGPLSGIEGWVEKRSGMSVVLLRLDFIGQAAAVKVEATDLEII